ncbi:HD domain-containing protein [Evansella sp. AB-rgal1]|uniref:HD domain-containing protein n=1 Tax=Evansella sp. AB-rgal1 TaxID=3242696 RepID=UPI00359EEDD6
MQIENILFHEPLYPYIEPHPWEVELFQSHIVRRLKQLAHFGAGSLVSSVVHSRYEHTIGVWKLTAYFFPENKELRTAAILHDVGHLPFSHAVEKSLGFNHHHLTEQYILENEISSILKKAKMDPTRIVNLLNRPTPLTGVGNILGLDHLDSFFRDTYMSGSGNILPKDLLHKLTCTTEGIETDKDTGIFLVKLIISDHLLFLSPFLVAVDRLLTEAIVSHFDGIIDERIHSIVRKTDSDILVMLKKSHSKKAQDIISLLVDSPHKIKIEKNKKGAGIPIRIRKLYKKTPLCERKPLLDNCLEAKEMFKELTTSIFYEYEVNTSKLFSD